MNTHIGAIALTKAQADLLRAIRMDRTRPNPRSEKWDVFVSLQDHGLVEDLGGGYARITQEGRYSLKMARPVRQAGQ